MNYPWLGCAAAVALSVCLMGAPQAQAVDLKQASETAKTVISAADRAALLPDSMNGQQAAASITKEQMCSLAVRLYASLTDTTYTDLMSRDSAKRSVCPFTDTTSADVQEAWLLKLTQEETGTFAPRELANRQQLLAMLYQAVRTADNGTELSENEIAEALYSYTDGTYVPDWAREGTAYFVRQGLTSGIGDNLLGIGEPISAEQASILTYRAAAAVHTGRGTSSTTGDVSTIAMHSGTQAVSWTGSGADYYLLYFYQNDDFSQKPVYVEQTASTGSGAQEYTLPEEIQNQPGIWYWSVDGFDCEGKLLASAQSTAQLTVTADAAQPETSLLMPETRTYTYTVPAQGFASEDTTGTQTDETVISSTIPAGMTYAGESYSDKVARSFGAGASYHKYASASEAKKHQVEIAVQVWDFDSNGNKVTRTKYLQIHEALASSVQQIFAEIYAGKERFPIHTLGGYNWRGDGSSSEHCLGTALDINWEENYMCTKSGAPLTGSYWKPGEDAYSIPANGEVVRIFAKYGFGWGGTITDPHGGANGGGTFSFKVVKKNNVIYLYNQASKLVVYFDKTGMHLAEDATIRWGSAKLAEVNADIQKMLAEDTETAIGVRTYYSMALRAEYTLIFSKKGGGILWNGTGWGDWASSRPDTATD